MSFRLFIYFGVICGAWSGFAGWALGFIAAKTLLPDPDLTKYLPYVLTVLITGTFLGLLVAFGLSLLDAAFNLSLHQPGKIFMRVFLAVLVALFGSALGSFIAGTLHWLTQLNVSFVLGWTIVGFLIGASICAFDILSSLITHKDFSGSFKKFVKCLIGGTLGGVIGGVIALIMKSAADSIFFNKDIEKLWSPTAIGFVAVGACIGLLVGLAQVILKEAWIKVEAGFRPGREMILTKEKTSIGRAESSDIALFGDSGIEKEHAYLVLDIGRYYLEDPGTPTGAYVNDQKVHGRMPLCAGDVIRVGNNVLRFHERAKKSI